MNPFFSGKKMLFMFKKIKLVIKVQIPDNNVMVWNYIIFSGHKNVIVALKCVSIVTTPGISTTLTIDMLTMPQLQLTNIGYPLEWTFLILLPNYCFGQGLATLYLNTQYLKICDTVTFLQPCDDKLGNPCCPGTLTNMLTSN
jgi:hypothetical protein